MKCIYCNTENDLTSSDIISYALTGAKLSKSFVCHEHNAFTNDNFEKKFISDLDFFRNGLGLLTREGNMIQFYGDIIIGDEVIRDIKLSDRKALYNPKCGIVTGKNSDNEKVLFGTKKAFEKMKGKSFNPIDSSKTVMRKTISSDIFYSDEALHTIAKISYEWFCYNNSIEEYIDTNYKDIVDYILNRNEDSIVQLVTDGNHYYSIDKMSDIGTNSFYQYDDSDGYTYVIFNLWNVISYKTKICRTINKDNSQIDNLFLDKYNIDGSKCVVPFAIFSFNGKFSIASIEVSLIDVDTWDFFAKRLNEIISTFIITIYSLKKYADTILNNLNKFENNLIDIAELLAYEEPNTIVTIKLMELISKNKQLYDQAKSFNENLYSFIDASEGKVKISDQQVKEYIKYLLVLNKNNKLIGFLNTIISDFNDIYNLEKSMNR